MLFEDLGLDTVLLKNVADQGYTSSTPIQAKAIPPLLKGRDLLGLAQTGTGKTAAFALPVLQRLSKAPRPSRGRAPRALVLAPTRELVGQIADAFGVYGRGLGIRATIVFGGVNQNPQIQALRRGVDIVVATPGRLLDLLGQGHVSLDAVSLLVLDEADRMLDMGFIKPIRQIASRLPPKRQSLLFSATMPKAMRKLADELLVDPVEVSIAPKMVAAPRIEQSILHVDRKFKPDILRDMLSAPDVERAIVFTRTKHGADRLAKKLGRSSTEAVVIHGNKSQNARNRALDAFRSGKTRVLIATDVVARGIDVDQVSHVINFDLPNDPESYVHRIGRTGRAGATGTAVSLCDPSERDYLKSIEKLTKRAIPVRQHPLATAEAAPPMPPAKPAQEPKRKHRSKRTSARRTSR